MTNQSSSTPVSPQMVPLSSSATSPPTLCKRTISASQSGRFVLAAAVLTLLNTSNSGGASVGVNAFVPTSGISMTRLQSMSNINRMTMTATAATNENKQRAEQDSEDTAASASTSSSPVVVSARAEALSHSKSTLKLTPSYDLFQLLSEEEGGKKPKTTSGNGNRDADLLKIGIPDTLSGVKLSDYIDGDKKIESLPDPFKMVEKELKPFSDSMSELVSTDQPILSMAAKHFFEKRHGKRFRPTIVQLMGKAVAASTPERAEDQIDSNTDCWDWTGASVVDVEGGVVTKTNHKGSDVWRKQAQLGQIVEMIHVATLIHDDVLDEADTRRGGESVHKLYSNKVAVLAGDYLLARASVLLARLENTAVVQIMAAALESLVSGEIMQLKAPPKSLLEMDSYLRKSYYKTASLICYATRSTALLGGHHYGSTVATACEEFGFHLGLAFQIQDDILDFTAAENVLGKPALADMDLGLSTAPILYAAEEFKELRPMIKRRFKNKGDKQAALEYLYKSPTAMNKARSLALFHAERAVSAIMRLPQSEARDSLVRLTHLVITRNK